MRRVAPGASPFRSPVADFSAPGSMPSGAPQSSTRWSRSLVTAFRSSATAAPSQKPPFRSQRSRPATSRPASSFPRPVRPLLPCLHWFAPVEGSVIAQARCASSRRLAQLLPLPPLPSRTFTSLGIEAFNRFRRLAARLPNSPDFPSLPATGSITRLMAADHRSRIATFPEACCSFSQSQTPTAPRRAVGFFRSSGLGS